MKKSRPKTKAVRESAGKRILAAVQEAVDWVEGKEAAVRVTTVEVPVTDVRAVRQRTRLVFARLKACAGASRCCSCSRV